mmetsp:Transcript_17271/g.60704  ORF Transcript_17271/g.60704 Transcript_17271/m.60704 type:complete len:380 (-) Transcript_17271:935-2074(-)
MVHARRHVVVLAHAYEDGVAAARAPVQVRGLRDGASRVRDLREVKGHDVAPVGPDEVERADGLARAVQRRHALVRDVHRGPARAGVQVGVLAGRRPIQQRVAWWHLLDLTRLHHDDNVLQRRLVRVALLAQVHRAAADGAGGQVGVALLAGDLHLEVALGRGLLAEHDGKVGNAGLDVLVVARLVDLLAHEALLRDVRAGVARALELGHARELQAHRLPLLVPAQEFPRAEHDARHAALTARHLVHDALDAVALPQAAHDDAAKAADRPLQTHHAPRMVGPVLALPDALDGGRLLWHRDVHVLIALEAGHRARRAEHVDGHDRAALAAANHQAAATDGVRSDRLPSLGACHSHVALRHEPDASDRQLRREFAADCVADA